MPMNPNESYLIFAERIAGILYELHLKHSYCRDEFPENLSDADEETKYYFRAVAFDLPKALEPAEYEHIMRTGFLQTPFINPSPSKVSHV